MRRRTSNVTPSYQLAPPLSTTNDPPRRSGLTTKKFAGKPAAFRFGRNSELLAAEFPMVPAKPIGLGACGKSVFRNVVFEKNEL